MNGDLLDKGPMVVKVMGSTLAVGGVFFWARVFTRTVIRPIFGLDDALIVLTWVRSSFLHTTSYCANLNESPSS
jgi:hypothetical protein